MKIFKVFTGRFWVLAVVCVAVLMVGVGVSRAIMKANDSGFKDYEDAVAVEFVRVSNVLEVGDVDGTHYGSINKGDYHALYRAVCVTDKGEYIPVLLSHPNVDMTKPFPVLVAKIKDGQSGQYFYYAPLPPK